MLRYTKISNSDIFVISDASLNVSDITITDSNGLIKTLVDSSIYVNSKKNYDSSTDDLIESLTENDFHVYHIYIPKTISLSNIIINSASDSIIIDFENTNDLIETINSPHYNKLIGSNSSFMLLRANPKLTGNIKVVVNSNSNLYMDTFKVLDSLNQRKYRRIELNPEEYYGSTIMYKFKGLSSDDLYKMEEKNYSIFTPSNTPNDQYYDVYNYGVRTNSDKLYSENFSLLAPLCIKKDMPDFFLIFKVKNLSDRIASGAEIKEYLKRGSIVKVFDMRENSNIGKYIRNVYNRAKDYTGDLFLSYDYDSFNVYNGISIERGEIAKIYESTSLERQIKNQVAMDDWYTLGFERNRIVSKDIINFEFMFDDTNEDLFSLNTYFGLYVRLNGEDEDFSCTAFNDGEIYFDASVSGENFNPCDDSSNLLPLIYGYSTPETFVRLNKNIYNADDELEPFVCKPHQNVSSAYISNFSSNISPLQYISILFNEPPEPCEHYRVILNETIYEVIFSNSINNIVDMSEINEYENDGYTIKRIVIYNTDFRSTYSTYSDDKIQEIKSYKINQLVKAFNSFDINIEAFYDNENVFSIICDDSYANISFEKISSTLASDDIDEYNDKSTLIFGLDIPSYKISPSETSISYLYPFGFEVFGDRYYQHINFYTLNENNYLIDTDIHETLHQHRTIIYQTNTDTEYTSKEYRILNNIEIQYYKKNDYDSETIDDDNIQQRRCFIGYGQYKCYLVSLNDPTIVNNKINFHTNYPINCGVCSIFPVKDFDFNVLDTDSYIDREHFSTDGGRYIDLRNNRCQENLLNYIDKNETVKFDTDVTCFNDASILEILTPLINADKTKSDISLFQPYCCKWRAVGTDILGKKIEAMFDYGNFGIENYYLINDTDDHVGYCTISDSSTDDKYINNYISYNEYPSFRENLLNGNSTIKDTLYTNNNSTDKMSDVYMFDSDTIEFISGGVKMQISSSNKSIINVSEFIGYQAAIISCTGNNSSSNYPFELFVDKTTHQMAFIIYNGCDNNSMIISDNSTHIPEIKQIRRYSNFDKYVADIDLVKIPDDCEWAPDTSVCDSNGAFMVVTSYPKNEDAYTLDSYVQYKGTLVDASLYNYEYSINGYDSCLYIDGSLCSLNNYYFNNFATKENPILNGFVILINNPDGIDLPTDSSGHIMSDTYTFNDITTIINNQSTQYPLSITIKDDNQLLDYSSTKVLKISTVKPVGFEKENSDYDSNGNDGSVYPTHFEPKVYDIINFQYDYMDSNESFNNYTFGKNFNGCNIIPTSISSLNQMWLRKYTTNTKLLNTENQKKTLLASCLFTINNFPIIKNCWDTNIFKTYESLNSSAAIFSTYIKNGYEKNMFFASRGLTLKTEDSSSNVINSISITKWKNVKTNTKKKEITIDITESIIDYIYKSDGFIASFAPYTHDMSDKLNYIKNTILPFIKIDSDSIVSVYRKKSTKFGFKNEIDDDDKKMNNIKKKLYQENNNYYITLLNLDDKYQYSMEIIFDL